MKLLHLSNLIYKLNNFERFRKMRIKQPIERRMCAAKRLTLLEPQASLSDSLQTEPFIAAVYRV